MCWQVIAPFWYLLFQLCDSATVVLSQITDVIKHAKFGDDRLMGSGVVEGQISAFPIDFAGRPYNTLTLPCERVMTVIR